MSFFFKLPECLSTEIVSEWIELKEIGKFDSAVCNKKLRSETLQLLSSLPSASVQNCKSMSFFDWLCLREITIGDLGFVLTENLSAANFSGHTDLKLRVNCLTISSWFPSASISSEHYFPFELNSHCNCEVVNSLLQKCKSVTKLKIEDINSQKADDPPIYITIIKNYPNLVSLTLSTCIESTIIGTHECIFSLLVNLPCVENLIFNGNCEAFTNTTQLENILHNCSHLRKLKISSGTSSNDNKIKSLFARKFPHISLIC
jgi:hypothetical protein